LLVDRLGENAQKHVKKSPFTTILKQALRFWSDLGKIFFSLSLSVQITFLSNEMTTRVSKHSKKLSSSQSRAHEGLQNPHARWHYTFASLHFAFA